MQDLDKKCVSKYGNKISDHNIKTTFLYHKII